MLIFPSVSTFVPAGASCTGVPSVSRSDKEIPFTENVVLFTESKVLGQTYWKKPADMNVKGSVAIKALNGHTLIKKFANEEPLEEVTMGIANAFPAWLSSSRSWLMATDSNTWNH